MLWQEFSRQIRCGCAQEAPFSWLIDRNIIVGRALATTKSRILARGEMVRAIQWRQGGWKVGKTHRHKRFNRREEGADQGRRSFLHGQSLLSFCRVRSASRIAHHFTFQSLQRARQLVFDTLGLDKEPPTGRNRTSASQDQEMPDEIFMIPAKPSPENNTCSVSLQQCKLGPPPIPH